MCLVLKYDQGLLVTDWKLVKINIMFKINYNSYSVRRQTDKYMDGSLKVAVTEDSVNVTAKIILKNYFIALL